MKIYKVDDTLKKILIVVCELLLLFAPEFIYFPKYTWLLAFIGIIVLFSRRSLMLYGIRTEASIQLLLLLAFNILWSAVSIIINKTDDYSYIIFLCGTILSVLRNFLLVWLIHKYPDKKNRKSIIYLKIFLYACFVYVAFTILFIIFPSFKNFWIKKVIKTAIFDYFAYEFRYSINGFAAFASSTIFSIAVILNAYLIVKSIHTKQWIKYYILYITMIVGCFFYGRICFVSIFISICYLIIFIGNKKSAVKLILLSVGIGVLLISILNFLASGNKSFEVWRNWAFAIIQQLFSGRGITDYSVIHMFKDMYFLPSLKTFLIGDGRYILPDGFSYYGHTDVGFMRSILFFGCIGCIVNYSMPIRIIKRTWRFYKKCSEEKAMLICLILGLIVLEMKGEAYHRILLMVMPLYYTSLYDFIIKNNSDRGNISV